MNLLPIIANSGFRPIDATGGTVTDITVSGAAWRVHSFSTTGTLTVNDIGDEGKIEYLVVAGGGAGGSADLSATAGGGGGGGGVRTNIGGTMATISLGSHAITVGTGGTINGATFVGTPGNNSLLPSSLTGSEIAATGGGRGAFFGTYPGGNGGSGGGGGIRTSTSQLSAPGTGNSGGYSPVEGYGGSGGAQVTRRAGGGGGAGAAATNVNGGAGVSNSITGASVTYAPGGNGGDVDVEAAGANATAIGGGGGGAADGFPTRLGGTGAAGIVVIRYPLEAL